MNPKFNAIWEQIKREVKLLEAKKDVLK